jgi:uncharacterized protein YebE (UPF0316 family)
VNLAESLPGILLPVVVFLAEVCVVTLSTVRIIVLSRGQKGLASLLGFFEVTLWLFAIGQIMQNLNDPGCFIGFAAGFTLGNYLGVLIEKWLGLGYAAIRVFTNHDPEPLMAELRSARHGVTRIDGTGTTGPVRIVLTVIKRSQITAVAAMIRRFDPNTFYAIEPVQTASAGTFPTRPLRTPTESVEPILRRWPPVAAKRDIA